MKQLLGIAAALLTAVHAFPAYAGEVKMGAAMYFVANTQHAMSTDGYYGRTPGRYVPFDVQQKVEMNFRYAANENLSASVQLQAGLLYDLGGPSKWGMGPKFLESDGFKVSEAYLDWRIPGTEASVRMGQWFSYLPYSHTQPNYVPIFSQRMPGVSVNIPLSGNVAVTGAWFRTATAEYGHSGGNWFYLSTDAKGEGWKVTAHASHLAHSFLPYLYKADSYIDTGFGFDYAVQSLPLQISGDFLYVRAQNMVDPNPLAPRVYDTSGWFTALKISYDAGRRGKPGLMGWYATGDRRGRGMGTGQVYSLANGYAPTNLYFGCSMTPAAIAFDGSRYSSARIWGTAGLIAEWSGLSFLPGFYHTAKIAYVRGTNSRHSLEAMAQNGGHCGYMTSHDHFVEADLDTMFIPDPRLMFVLQLGYLWEGFENPMVKNGWKTTFSAIYRF